MNYTNTNHTRASESLASDILFACHVPRVTIELVVVIDVVCDGSGDGSTVVIAMANGSGGCRHCYSCAVVMVSVRGW